MPLNYQQTAFNSDWSSRIVSSSTVVASPSAAAETIIASITLPGFVQITNNVIVSGWCAYTVGTNGTTVELRIRQTGLAGAVVGDTGALSGSQHGAAILSCDDVTGLDTAATGGTVYKMTMQVANGSATSTVSAVVLYAMIV